MSELLLYASLGWWGLFKADMALIIMCCHDTVENKRSEYTKQTLNCLRWSVDWNKHRLVILDNGSCDETKQIIGSFSFATIINNDVNVGTARGVNQGLRLRKPGECACKIDNDVEIASSGWADELEEAIERCPEIGVLGLKRKDLAQSPTTDNLTFRSELVMLPHLDGQKWIVAESHPDIMGTCTMYNWRLIDAIGGLIQPNTYGLDDCLYCLRSTLAGFWNGFLPHIDITHLDTGSNPYTQEKQKVAGEAWPIYQQWHTEYCEGKRDLYVEI